MTLKHEVDVLVINTEYIVKKTILLRVNAIHSNRMCWRQTKNTVILGEKYIASNVKYDML